MKSSRMLLYIFVLVLTASSILYLTYNPKTTLEMNNDPIIIKFEYLTANRNSACYGISTVMKMPDDNTIMGSCCGPMILHTYKEQLQILEEKHVDMGIIPKDPYNISVNWAKEMIIAFKTIQLSSDQQKIYEDAKILSHERGPCCCGSDKLDETCWRWKVYGGLAKKLITEYDFDAEQIAHVWDISDGCGGDHHVESVHG